MNALEEYFVEAENIEADSGYITDSFVIADKCIINKSFLKQYETMNDIFTFIKFIPDTEELWELPNKIYLMKHGGFRFQYNKKYSFDYKFVKLFCDSLDMFPEFRIQMIDMVDEKNVPLLKIYENDNWVGAIVAIKNKKYK